MCTASVCTAVFPPLQCASINRHKAVQSLGTSYGYGLGGRAFHAARFLHCPAHSLAEMYLKVIPCNWCNWAWQKVQSSWGVVQVVASHQINMCYIKGYVAAIYNDAWWVAWVTGYVAATYNTGTSTHVWGRDIRTGLGTGVRMPTRIWGLGRDTHTGLGTGVRIPTQVWELGRDTHTGLCKWLCGLLKPVQNTISTFTII